MRKNIYHQMAHHCGKKEGGSLDDVNGWIELNPTHTPRSKCVQACLIEASGLVNARSFGKLSEAYFKHAVLNFR